MSAPYSAAEDAEFLRDIVAGLEDPDPDRLLLIAQHLDAITASDRPAPAAAAPDEEGGG